MSSTYSIRLPRWGKALGAILVCCGLLMIPLFYLIGLPEIGFSISFVMSDHPLLVRIMYVLVRVVLLFAPPFSLLIGLLAATGKSPWILKEIVLEPDRIVFRRRDGNELALYEIKEVKPYRFGLQIVGRTAAGKQVTRPVLRSNLGEEEFTMFKSDLERLYGVEV
jgi:hypothetical protein